MITGMTVRCGHDVFARGLTNAATPEDRSRVKYVVDKLIVADQSAKLKKWSNELGARAVGPAHSG